MAVVMIGVDPHKSSVSIEARDTVTERLVATGHAYPAGGDVYFRVSSDDDYGRLSGRSVDEMLAGYLTVVTGYNERAVRKVAC